MQRGELVTVIVSKERVRQTTTYFRWNTLVCRIEENIDVGTFGCIFSSAGEDLVSWF